MHADDAAKYGLVSKVVENKNLEKEVWAALREHAMDLSPLVSCLS